MVEALYEGWRLRLHASRSYPLHLTNWYNGPVPDRPLLSKSLFRSGRECGRRMWFDVHERYRKPAPTDAERARWADAAEVREWARKRYPNAVLARYAGLNDEMAAANTRELMDGDAEAIFDGTFLAAGRIARCDVLRRTPEGWALEVVKGSTFEEGKKKVKPEHVTEAAFQLAVLLHSGVKVTGVELALLDRTYRWNGEDHDVNRLFVRVDITADAERRLEEVEELVAGFDAVVADPNVPSAELNTHCKKCDYKDHCLRKLPADDLLFMTQARKSHVDRWRAAGYRTIRDLPEDLVTDARMLPTWHALTTGQPWISEGLSAALDEIQFPAAFVDFESCATAIPAYPGTVPYEQICFQWSAHILTAPDAAPIHLEYLHETATDPRPDFCQTLWGALEGVRSIVTYSIFEPSQARAFAQANLPFATEIADLFSKGGVDLEKLVGDHIYLPAFNYRTSIKTVLPALVPTMSYKDLLINDGSTAMIAFRRMINPDTPPFEALAIATDLRTYCKQDTLAMVEIYRALLALAHRAG